MPSSPVLSVIIPVYNDPNGLRQTLSSLVDQCNSPEFEIIVVDNDSTDETPQVIEEFEREYSDIVCGCEETAVQSSYAARNTGIENASSEIFVFIDADITVRDTWLSDISEKFQGSSVDYLGCEVEMYITEDQDSIWAQYDASMGLPVEHYLETKQFAPTCALAVRREVVEDVGHFNKSLTSGGDKEFGRRVDRAGYRMDYDDQLVVRHPVRTTMGEHVEKAKRIGVGQYQLWRRFDFAPHPFYPTRFLPPNPSRITNRSCSDDRMALLYLIDYFLKIVQTISAGREFLNLNDG